ncbi:MAG: hypothetical protein IT373_17560 [Polyangiaceae bacterium]|nr:hypothetical protein [Polyangiaceae bacterium]
MARWLVPALFVVGSGVGACTLSREGSLRQDCTTPVECDDGNVCTSDLCSTDGLCSRQAVPDGPVAEGQTAGDCLRLDCQGGALVAVADSGDVKDDGNSCTTDSCGPGGPISTPLPDGTACDDGNGHTGICGAATGSTTVSCQVSCTAANAATQCDDANACTIDSCNVAESVCVRDPLDGIEVPGATQTPGDCQLLVCALGLETSVADDGDRPDDGNDCTTDSCVAGVPDPAHPPLGLNAPCDDGGGAYCDGNGTCVACNDNDQCGDPSCLCTQCKGNTCIAADPGSAAACQSPNDCHTVHCNGSGGSTDDVDDTDLPASDNNGCTNETCSNGSPAHVPNTAACNDNLYCNGTDTCSGGACTVHAGNPCPGADGDGDCSETCREANDDCNGNDPDASGCNDGLYCNGTDTCSTGACSVHSGNPCPGPDGDGDCSETCREANDDCNGNDLDSSVCNDGLYCTLTDRCQTGTCTGTGSPCPGPDGDGDCSETCREANDDCNGNDIDNTACTDGLYCTLTDRCQAGTCTGTGSPCPGPDGDGDCSETCREANDDCNGNDAPGSGCEDGLYCTTGDTCNTGTCNGGSGNPCPGHNAMRFCNDSCDETLNNCTALDAVNTPCDEDNDSNLGSCNASGNCTSD